MKKIKLLASLLSVFLLLGILIGCGSDASKDSNSLRTDENATPLEPLEGEEQPGDKEAFDSYVYSVEKLKEEYEDVVVLDARTKEEYDKGHLPGAVQAHWTDWSNVQVEQGEDGWAQILSNKELKEKFGQLGIDGTKPVVIYNNPLVGWGEEGRQAWTFRVFGLEDTYILNGGIDKWEEAGGEVSTEAPKVVAVEGPEPNPNPNLFADTDYLVSNLDNVKILDAREDEEFAGEKTYGEAKEGRIPNSEHVWFKDFYNADGTLQTPAQIRARVESLGFGTEDEVVSYCTGGIRSGFATMALRMAGFDKARNYNVSFSEWVGSGQTIDTTPLEEK